MHEQGHNETETISLSGGNDIVWGYWFSTSKADSQVTLTEAAETSRSRVHSRNAIGPKLIVCTTRWEITVILAVNVRSKQITTNHL